MKPTIDSSTPTEELDHLRQENNILRLEIASLCRERNVFVTGGTLTEGTLTSFCLGKKSGSGLHIGALDKGRSRLQSTLGLYPL